MAAARLFLAIDLTEEVRLRLTECVKLLSNEFRQVKWVRSAAMHMTMHFLGDTPLERLEELSTVVAGAVSACEPFCAAVEGLGVFPHLRRPTVWWAGINDGQERFAQLAAPLRSRVGEAGFGCETKPFTAHITLGRVRAEARFRPETVRAALDRWQHRRFGLLAVKELRLYASTLAPNGPHYEILDSWPLTAALPQ